MEPELFEMLLQSMQEANTIKLSNEVWEQLEETLDNPPEAIDKVEGINTQ